jgi:hypothetical protein
MCETNSYTIARLVKCDIMQYRREYLRYNWGSEDKEFEWIDELTSHSVYSRENANNLLMYFKSKHPEIDCYINKVELGWKLVTS